ncbi:hypothetical protein [Sphingobacterium cellulitidis]|uniref:hypothetical protein n=1 Tax=Sphingobacterium cellulitidis TaxID=1768011 RepID=UPI000B93BEDB|nr:hypothetical protein CHT99_10375 [Sphingobacterium cellulitidis]
MFVSGTKEQKIEFLKEFYEKKYLSRDFSFRAIDVSSGVDTDILEEMILEISRYTEFRLMKFKDNEGVYFVICKI